LFMVLFYANHPFMGQWNGTGCRPTLTKRIAEGAWLA
jgi:hypothetical protein